MTEFISLLLRVVHCIFSKGNKKEKKLYKKRIHLPLISASLLIFSIIFFIAAFCWAETGNLRLGYINDSEGIETYQVRIKGASEKEKDTKIGIVYSFQLYKQQREDVLESLNIDSTIQLNYYFDPFFAFTAIDYGRAINTGINDEISTGIGAGIKDKFFKIQSGIYINSENTIEGFNKNILNQSLLHAEYFINDDLSLETDDEFKININRSTDYEIFFSGGPKVKLSKSMTGAIVYEYQYINEPVIGNRDYRKFMLELGVNF
mgnify:CR=1 FL=1